MIVAKRSVPVRASGGVTTAVKRVPSRPSFTAAKKRIRRRTPVIRPGWPEIRFSALCTRRSESV